MRRSFLPDLIINVARIPSGTWCRFVGFRTFFYTVLQWKFWKDSKACGWRVIKKQSTKKPTQSNNETCLSVDTWSKYKINSRSNQDSNETRPSGKYSVIIRKRPLTICPEEALVLFLLAGSRIVAANEHVILVFQPSFRKGLFVLSQPCRSKTLAFNWICGNKTKYILFKSPTTTKI